MKDLRANHPTMARPGCSCTCTVQCSQCSVTCLRCPKCSCGDFEVFVAICLLDALRRRPDITAPQLAALRESIIRREATHPKTPTEREAAKLAARVEKLRESGSAPRRAAEQLRGWRAN